MLRIRSEDIDEIISHSKKSEPIEACGILAGKVAEVRGEVLRDVLKVYSCTNELNSPTEYRIKAEEQLRVFDDIDRAGLDLLGFYHSHPGTDSRPSLVDKDRANYFGYSYLIISLYPTRVSAWILEGGGFKEEEIRIVADQDAEIETIDIFKADRTAPDNR